MKMFRFIAVDIILKGLWKVAQLILGLCGIIFIGIPLFAAGMTALGMAVWTATGLIVPIMIDTDCDGVPVRDYITWIDGLSTWLLIGVSTFTIIGFTAICLVASKDYVSYKYREYKLNS
tara:strand:- start:6730 stop:7086 length:357 start_codon:yes stop_codon:yes gene_type:complete